MKIKWKLVWEISLHFIVVHKVNKVLFYYFASISKQYFLHAFLPWCLCLFVLRHFLSFSFCPSPLVIAKEIFHVQNKQHPHTYKIVNKPISTRVYFVHLHFCVFSLLYSFVIALALVFVRSNLQSLHAKCIRWKISCELKAKQKRKRAEKQYQKSTDTDTGMLHFAFSYFLLFCM